MSVPRIAFTIEEAARALGISRDFFEQWVLPKLRTARIKGRGQRPKLLVPVQELERFIDSQATRVLDG